MKINSYRKVTRNVFPMLKKVSFIPTKSFSSIVDFHKKKLLEKSYRRNNSSYLKTEIIPQDNNYHNLALSLEEWDKKHVNEYEKGNYWRRKLKKRTTNLMFDNKNDLINFKTQISQDVQKLRSIRSLQHIETFNDDMEETKSNLFANNININKTKFDFSKFKRGDQTSSFKNYFIQSFSQSSFPIKNEEQDIKDNDKMEIDKTCQQNNMKVNDKYEPIISKENYKDIITEKHKLEKILHNQLVNTIKKIIAQKEQIIHIEKEIQNTNEKLSFHKQQYLNYKEAYEIFLTEVDKIIGTSKNYYKNFSEMSNIHSKKQEAKNELENRYIKYKTFATEYTTIISKLRYSFKEAKHNIKTLQQLYNKLTIESRNYYYNLLQEGLDVRDSGLSWIVYKLYELDADVKIEHFPSFVDYPSFRYLIEYSNKRFILAKMNTLMNSIKKYFVKRNSIHSSKQKELRVQIKQGKHKVLSKSELSEFIEDFNKVVMDKNVVKLNETEMSDVEKTKKALRYIKSISQGMENGINKDGVPMLELFEEERKKFNNLFKTYGLNKEAILNVLVFIKERINKIEKEMNEMKKEHRKYLKKKHYQNKTKSISDCAKYDLLYAALFGNHVIL